MRNPAMGTCSMRSKSTASASFWPSPTQLPCLPLATRVQVPELRVVLDTSVYPMKTKKEVDAIVRVKRTNVRCGRWSLGVCARRREPCCC